MFGAQLICGLALVLDAEPVLGARVCLVQSRCLELGFGEELVSGAEWPVLGKSSSLARRMLEFAAELACGAEYCFFY